MAEAGASLAGPAARPTQGAASARRTKGGLLALVSVAYLAAGALVLFEQSTDFADAARKGLLVPDVVNITQTFDNFWASGGLKQSENEFAGLSWLYGWTWALTPALCFLVNAVLMGLSLRLYVRRIMPALTLPAWTVLGVVGNPYLLLAMPGPNKEIPLLLLTLYWFACAVRNVDYRILKMVIAALLAVQVRSGHGLLLLILVPLVGHPGRERAQPWIIAAACLAIAAFYSTLVSFVPVVASNFEAFESISLEGIAVGAAAAALVGDPVSPAAALTLYVFRLIYNAFSLALFPVTSTVDGLTYYIGFSYWIFGILVLAALPAILHAAVDRDANRGVRLAGNLALATLFMVSVSQFVQPRYLMPVLPMMVAVLGASRRGVKRLSIGSAALLVSAVVGAYSLMGRAPAPAEPEDFEPPAYLWSSGR